MDASRIDFDTASLRCSPVALKAICVAVVDLFEPIILQEQRLVEIDIAEECNVWADESRLKQVLHNLLGNALRYSPCGTPVRISASSDRQQATMRVRITDRGPGVPPDQQEAIFERFVRLERDMHGNNRGSGLGLAITRQLVEAMHGSMHVESSGISGAGSTFSFSLPAPPEPRS